jgi:subfamily B ATP-binding cassette protein MsbA
MPDNASDRHEPPSGWATYGRLLVYVRAYWPAFILSIAGFILYALTQSAFAGLMQYLPAAFDTVSGSGRELARWEQSLRLDQPDGIRVFLPAALVVIVTLRGIGSYLGGYYITYVARNVVNQLRLDLFSRINHLPGSFFDLHPSGHLISTLTFNVEQVTSAASNAIKVLIREGLTVVALLSYIFYLNWKLSLVFLLVGPPIGLIINIASRQFKKYSHRIQDSMGGITQVASEAIRGLPVVRVFGGSAYEQQRFAERNDYTLRQSLKLARVNEISTPFIQLLTFSAIAVLFWFGLDPALKGGMDAGQFLSYITAASLVAKPLRQLTSINAGIQRGIAASESIFSILDQPPEPDHGTLSLARARGRIEFRGLDFAFAGAAAPALRGIELVIEPGETVALVGRSGAGKSTLAGLIARFHPPPPGRLLLDGEPVENYRLADLRHNIALVTQQTVLFQDTVANNIAYGELRDAPMEAIERAARDAHALEFIQRLPQGFATVVGEDGADLSGGQRQRLALARAFLKDAPILILDEATSALDTESERHIQAALDSIMRDRTTLVIAHRLSTVERADKIVVLDEGLILEIGSHAELLAREGAYAGLYRSGFDDAVPHAGD